MVRINAFLCSFTTLKRVNFAKIHQIFDFFKTMRDDSCRPDANQLKEL
jgi:hypothetical protein